MKPYKHVVIKLFYNISNHSYYLQIGDTLFPVKDKVVTAIQEREGLDIRRVTDIKEMQLTSLADEKSCNILHDNSRSY